MLNKAAINNLKRLVGDGRLREAFDRIEEALDPLPSDFISIYARYKKVNDEYSHGRLKREDFEPVFNQCNAAFLQLLDSLEKEGPAQPRFGPHHQFACDREELYSEFVKLLNNPARPRIHFFSMFGGEAQAHRGIFTRCVNRLEGVDLSHLNPERTSGYLVKDFPVTVPYLEDVRYLEIELPRMILAEMGIGDKEMEQMGEKNLAFGLAKSPLLSRFGSDDKVLFHLSITEALWNARIVPDMTRRFIRNFCLANLPDEAPELFFFFSIEYDDDNRDIRDQVSGALIAAEFLVNLGELKMVTRAQVAGWFTLYKDYWETVSDRKQTQARYFGDQPDEMYMDEVQVKLKKIIEEINKEEKNGKRN